MDEFLTRVVRRAGIDPEAFQKEMEKGRKKITSQQFLDAIGVENDTESTQLRSAAIIRFLHCADFGPQDMMEALKNLNAIRVAEDEGATKLKTAGNLIERFLQLKKLITAYTGVGYFRAPDVLHGFYKIVHTKEDGDKSGSILELANKLICIAESSGKSKKTLSRLLGFRPAVIKQILGQVHGAAQDSRLKDLFVSDDDKKVTFALDHLSKMCGNVKLIKEDFRQLACLLEVSEDSLHAAYLLVNKVGSDKESLQKLVALRGSGGASADAFDPEVFARLVGLNIGEAAGLIQTIQARPNDINKILEMIEDEKIKGVVTALLDPHNRRNLPPDATPEPVTTPLDKPVSCADRAFHNKPTVNLGAALGVTAAAAGMFFTRDKKQDGKEQDGKEQDMPLWKKVLIGTLFVAGVGLGLRAMTLPGSEGKSWLKRILSNPPAPSPGIA